MPRFRNINYGRMLYEALRGYWAVNYAGRISRLYEYCACLVQPLQAPFDNYAKQRTVNALIAQCKYLIGQLTNLLNYLYDSELKRIFITQSQTETVSAPTFPYTSNTQARTFGEPAILQARGFFDPISTTLVVINVPAGTDIPSITATIEQVRLQGIPYTINILP